MEVVLEALPGPDGRSAAERHFGAARLGDARRTKALVESVGRILARPHGSLPQKLGGPAAVTRFYRLLRHEMVGHESVLAPHRQRARERMAGEAVVLVLHDSTELDFTGRRGLEGDLGRIGNGSRLGYVCHNSLAVTPDGRVLGLLSQVLHVRREVPRGEGHAAKRAHPGRESRLWPRGAAACGEAAAERLVVDVADRGGDTAEFIRAEVAGGRRFLVRSCKDRRLDGDEHYGQDRVCLKLHEYARQLPPLGERVVRVHANRGRHAKAAREARVSVAAGPVTLPPAARWERGEAPEGAAGTLDLWCVCVREVGTPPAGEEPIEWVLLSDLPARDRAEACKLVDWYCRRPLIEELHRAMKQGMGVEDLRLADPERLGPAIATLSASAAILLGLREAFDAPAAEHEEARRTVPAALVEVLAAVTGLMMDMSLRRFALEVAKLGGHLPRKGRRPGWITLWRGWARLNAMAEGVAAVRAAQATKRKRTG